MNESKQATKHELLLMHLFNPNRPKTETEYAAAREIEQLRAKNEKLRNLLASSEEYVSEYLTHQKSSYEGYESFSDIADIDELVKAMQEALNND
jgi:hypothetical protein